MTQAAYEHNGHPVERAAFYAIACDPRRSIAVEACAGAGKTWMLVSRILRALLEGSLAKDGHGTAAHEILAITFTKKAAGEMRQRLNEWLVEFAQATPEKLAEELLARGVPPAQIAVQAPALKNLYPQLLASARPVQIRTFHSWFAALLRTAPLAVLQDLGLPANYSLLEDDTEAVTAVWPRFYATVVDSPNARADFEALVAVHGRFQAHKALASALNKRVEFVLADAQGVVDASVPPFDVQFPAFAGLAAPEDLLWAQRPLLQEAAGNLGRASAVTFSAAGSALEQALTAHDADAVLAALLTQKGTARKFGEKIVGIATVRAAQDLVLQVVQAQLQNAAWAHQQRMARLTRVLIAELAALKYERGWVDMNDVERAASVMLSDPVLSGWVQERLDAKVKHLLIDEFQDTSPLQWQALHAWLSGYAGAAGAPSVFIVGDPKQSIYRFRRAEPQVFRAAQAFVVDGLGGDLLSCDHTRRNAPLVMAAVNAVMSAAQAAGAYDGFRDHTTESTALGALRCLPAIPRDANASAVQAAEGGWRDSLGTPREEPEDTLRTLECRQAAQWLAGQLADGLRPKDVMVLARRRERLGHMRDALRALHIPTQQPEKADLADAPEVQDIAALLDALVSTHHDLSLAQALKSPLFGVTDADLVHLAQLQRAARADADNTADSSWWSQLHNTEQLPQALSALAPVLMQWKQWLDALPPHDALDAIYAHGDVLARFAAAAPAALRTSVLANLRAVLGTALQLNEGRFATPYALVRALKAGGVKAPVTSAPDAVRLLTVHGAKGLEAALVLLLDTDSPPSKAETMGVLVDWPGEAEYPVRLVFLASESNPPACVVDVLAIEQAARQREELNGLYVAMTRARSQLVLSSVVPHKAVDGSWWQRLQPLGEMVAPLASVDPLEAAVADADFTLLVVPDIGLQVAPPRPEPGANATESRIGQAMHRLLEWGTADAVQQQAAAREFGLDAEQSQKAATMAAAIRAGEGAWAWDAEVIDWAGNEVALNYQGKTLRLDRLVRRKDTGAWWVLDHKSKNQPQRDAGLVQQLEAYRAALRVLYPGTVVEAAFLTGTGGLVLVE
ncbi:exodeoxyribonuclease V subunit beta [Rhodoferax sp.]|uniref:UvrD-helicase domain-containing protein n=1 Tax=Rhodoferax sp. TaxID=50421 RepID=UPI0025E231D0|nr:UvrD-helicase domain-containing protein [Rhodoferax sp.]